MSAAKVLLAAAAVVTGLGVGWWYLHGPPR
jgi:hypothetical protein